MSDRQLTDGSPVPRDGSHTELKANGQQKEYVVLTPAERAKGWVKPYRDSYTHNTCGTLTTMGRAISETYARDPYFYSGTFCCGCGAHFPLDQFHWSDGEPMEPSLQPEWLAMHEAKTKELEARKLADQERKERAELARLKAKYDSTPAPPAAVKGNGT